MDEETFNWLELGNLLIGIGTFVLAAVVLFVNDRNTKRGQRIHVADKRSEWIKEFRTALSSFLTELNQVHRAQISSNGKLNEELFKPLYDSMNKITLLVYQEDENSAVLLEDLAQILEIGLKDKKEYSHLIPGILKTGKKIIDKEWELIKKLKD